MTLPRLAWLSAAVLVAAGCGRSVAVQPLPIDSAQTRQACADLIAGLPGTISAGRSWAVEPDPQSTAAWGSPSVVLRCGDGAAGPEPTEQLLSIDGIDWLVTPLTDGEQFTSVGRAPGVVVAIPSTYAPTAQVLAELNPTVARETAAVP